ncbi:Nn.00g003670.m01.CDS01 [Neocucurbitaria sp. VM-36]
MDADISSFEPLHPPPWLQPVGSDLVELPTELLNIIASYVGDADLFSLRAVSNRGIRDGIDHIWAKRFFTHRHCRTTERSIAHLEAVVKSRFARHIRSIVIKMCVEWRLSRILRKGPESFGYIIPPCSSARACLKSLCSNLTTIFKYTTHLNTLKILAPSKPYEVTNAYLGLPLMHQVPEPGPFNWPNINTYNHGVSLYISRMMFLSIIMAMKESNQRLHVLAILDFTNTTWQSLIPLTIPMLKSLVRTPSLQWLIRLELDVELFTDTSDDAITDIVELIRRNEKLQHLKLWAGPNLEARFKFPSEHWSSLLDLLGTEPPPFRLCTLDLDGLITSGTTTLDRIIDVHAPTIRRVSLNHISFRIPNSIRAFFAAMARTNLNYFAINNFWMHDRCWMRGSTMTLQRRPDEVLEWHGDGSSHADETYMDWIEVTWNGASYNDWVIYDNVNGTRSENWMKDRMLSVVEMVDCGSIEDFDG